MGSAVSQWHRKACAARLLTEECPISFEDSSPVLPLWKARRVTRLFVYFELYYDLFMQVTPFQQKVYEVVRKIPKGKTMTYSQVAVAIGKPRAARAVGNALNKNPYAPVVPCHRVIRSDGSIGGFASGSSKKVKLLKSEGAI